MSRWFERAFGADYLAVYAHRDLDEARRDVDGLLDLGLSGPVLDLACGAGRHLVALAERGLEVVGLDLSAAMLEAARDQPGCQRLVRGDSCRAPFRAGSFRAALSLFTSFGYHADRRRDAEQLGEVARLLEPGGQLFLDLPQPAALGARLVHRSKRRVGERVVREVRSLEGGASRVVKQVSFEGPGGLIPGAGWTERVNLYEPDVLDGLLLAAGLEVEGRWAGFDGSEFRPGATGSQRQVIRARRLL